jgi:3'-phosphoadenosine 5'-phosphosulfate sulfotransferase (PAPS reductase)/FAD synthetase
MLLMMLERGMVVDKIIFCDTGMEFPQMYEHIEKVNEYIFKNYGKQIEVIKADNDFNYWMFEHTKTKGKHKGEKGFGWSTPLIRWCTGALKREPSKKYLKTLGKYTNYIGIAFDEEDRHSRIKENEVHPLYDWGITEKEALEYCYSKGFDWGGLYENFSRLSCWCCPMMTMDNLRSLRKNFPDLWQKLLEMDSRTDTKFKTNYSVQELEQRFAYEDEHGIQKRFKKSLLTS